VSDSEGPRDELAEALALFDYSPESSKRSLADLVYIAGVLAKKYREYCARPMSSESDFKCLVYGQISAYVLLQLRRAQASHDGDTDVLAWASRNLEEIKALVKHLTIDQTNIYHYILENEVDEKELYEKISAIPSESHFSEMSEEIITRRIQRGLPLKRLNLTLTPADSAIYKLQSKFIHPSAWLVLGLEGHLDSSEWRSMFHVFITTTATEIVAALMSQIQEIRRGLGGEGT
jgi:hypothetical protein